MTPGDQEVRRILMVRLSSVGDILLATPVARWLRSQYPDAELTWLVDRGYEDLVRLNPNLDRVSVFDFLGDHRGPVGIRRLAKTLEPVDLLVDLQHKVRTTMLHAWLRPGRRRVMVKRRGLDLARAMVGRDTILRGPHQVLRYLRVVGADCPPGGQVKGPELRADARRVAQVRSGLAGRAGDRPVVGIVPGARHATKRWTFEHLRELITRGAVAGWEIVILGGPDERTLIEGLASPVGSKEPVTMADGDLGELAAWLAACDLVIGCDSGPAHMAAALGAPTLALFGPTSPERWAPIGERVKVLRIELGCSPCSNHGGGSCPVGTFECMRNLTPDVVFEAACEMIAAGKDG